MSEKMKANIICLNGEELKEKYQAAKGLIGERIKFFCKKFEERPFNEKENKVWVKEIADHLIFENLDYKEKEFKGVGYDEKEFEEPQEIFSVRGQIESFWKKQPFFYDESKLFWLWDLKNKKYILSDEINFLNLIQKKLGVETINNKSKGELISGFQQIGRLHKPKPNKKEWVQFKDKIYNIQTGESFEASPDYFITNPIPYDIGESEETPTIDKLFIEWVGEKYKPNLYEFISYSISCNQFMQRIFAFCGGGSNGKGTFMKLNEKFIGEENCVSSEIKALSERQFEPAVLYKKLLCIMGEVSYDDLKNTNILKKIAGEDRMNFEFKGKTPFTEENTATCVCLTNSLPTTPDKSLGFYRKWLIIDFPNQFKEINKKLIEEIPEKEFNNLAAKCLRILKELYKNPKFSNEGDFEDRVKRYEERSNPVLRFVEEYCEETAGESLILRDFTNSCNNYLKSKHLRVLTANQISKTLKNEGFVVGNRKINDISAVVILNLKIIPSEKLLELLKLSKSQIISYKRVSEKSDSFDSSDSFQEKIREEEPKIIHEKITKKGFSKNKLKLMLQDEK